MTIRERVAQTNKEAIMWDDLDDAVVGMTDDGRVVYDINKMVDLFSIDMPEEDAIEWINFNILGAHLGDYTPVHIYTLNKI